MSMLKCFRIINLSDHYLPATNLYFLDRADAQRYQKVLLWPYETLGYFSNSDGSKLALDAVQFRVELQMLAAIYHAGLDWVLWKKEGKLVYTPLVPGRCFDPESYRQVGEHEMSDPDLGPKIVEAEGQLGDHKAE
jgi:hypothetical protein